MTVPSLPVLHSWRSDVSLVKVFYDLSKYKVCCFYTVQVVLGKCDAVSIEKWFASRIKLWGDFECELNDFRIEHQGLCRRKIKLRFLELFIIQFLNFQAFSLKKYYSVNLNVYER